MNKITIKVHGSDRSVTVPESWNELQQRDLLLIYSTLFHNPGSDMTAQAWTMLKLISITKYLLKIEEVMLAAWESDCIRVQGEEGQMQFYDELRQVVHASIDGLFLIEADEEGNTKYSPKLNLTRNPYPHLIFQVKEGKKREEVKYLYGPDDRLGNITIYELGYCFTMFENYLETGDDDMANELLAVMYRPSRPRSKDEADSAWSGDRRTPLRRYEAKVQERVILFQSLNIVVKRVLIFWFASCRQSIIDRYPSVFKKRSTVQYNRTDYGWAGVMLSLAGGPAQLDQVSDQHYSNALTWLSMKEEEVEEMQRQRKA